MGQIIIGLCGEKESGKDTVGAYLVKEHGFERKAFFDAPKKAVAIMFGIPFSEVNKLRDDTDVLVGIGKLGEPEYEQWIQYIGYKALTMRALLQQFGDALKEAFGPNFIVDQTLPVPGFYPGRAIVVTDVRFREEAERIIHLGGRVIKIERDNPGADDEPRHRSEVIDFHHLLWCTLDNNGTHEELYAQVEDVLAKTPLESVC